MNSVKGIPSLWFMTTSIRFLFDQKLNSSLQFGIITAEEDFTRDENILERSKPMKYDRNRRAIETSLKIQKIG